MESQIPQKTPEVVSAASSFTPQTLFLASFVIAILTVFVGLFIRKRNLRSKGTDLILVGPPDAGKTSLMAALVYDQSIPTHTSMQTNSSVCAISPHKPFRVIDVPGHPRVRQQFQEHLPNAKVIAFVVDSSTISRNGPAVAEHLHHILHSVTSLPPSRVPPSLLIVAHKSDLLKTGSGSVQQGSVATSRVKTILERELEKRRAAQSGGVGIEGLGEEDEKTELGGLGHGDGTTPFKFDDWEGGEVSFVSTFMCPGKAPTDSEKSEGRDGLFELREWLVDNM